MRTVRLLISGRVQGVGDRDWTRREAAALGLVGWVRNLRDGRVEVLAAGEAAAIDAFIERARIGPRLARVDDVALEPAEPPANAGFEERPTC